MNDIVDPQQTVDEFIAEVVMDDRRSILVYRRRHGGREYVRWRVFHRHQKRGSWYPDKRRRFVIPVSAAESLARAIAAGPAGLAVSDKPTWLAKTDANREHRLRCMVELNAPKVILDHERRRQKRMPGR